MFDKTPAPTNAEKALDMMLPQNKMAFLVVSSLRVYHLDWISRAPGRKAASTNPKKNRTKTMPVKLLVFPVSVEMRPHSNIAQER